MGTPFATRALANIPTFLCSYVCLPHSTISVLLFLLPFSPVFCHHVMSNHCTAGQALSRVGRKQEPKVESSLTGTEMTLIIASPCKGSVKENSQPLALWCERCSYPRSEVGDCGTRCQIGIDICHAGGR
ncbi:hypothetical protein XENOCAPTIV_025992 [Xenoophorus captivus]|uniref:Secreted protein n=1 Tax=Xenoophorus captivus TaxID=1517983 RepID=A0ABV0QEM2_9TELE